MSYNESGAVPVAAQIVPPRTSKLAIASLVAGLLFPCLGPGSLAGIICGHLALRAIRRQPVLRGRAIARAGLVLSYLGLILFVATALCTPWLLKEVKKSRLTKAGSNGRYLHTLLVTFESEHGSFPNNETAAKLKLMAPGYELEGASSNAYFRQLFVAGLATDENPFHVPGALGTHRPDGRMDGPNALAAGECGIAYVTGCASTQSPDRPVLLAPLVPGSERFDPGPFAGKALVIFLDGRIQHLPVDPSGHAILDGRNLLDPAHPCWSGMPPVLALPDIPPPTR